MIRSARDEDAPGIIALITACWSEYPGLVMDVDGENPELRRFASHCADGGGAAWVAEQDGEIAGMIGVTRLGDRGDWEIKRLYVAARLRGGGLARRLLAEAEGRAISSGHGRRLLLWTDTRFERAHRFYERQGYVRYGPIRALDDRSHSIEFGYEKPVGGTKVLDAAAAARAERALAVVLVECVAAGAAVTFLPPLAPETARLYWRGVSAGVARGETILLAAWHGERLAGTVQVALDTPPNQPHRAEVRKLLVLPEFRRRGIGKRLMACAEAEAARAGRRLLTLDTRAGDAAELLYRGMGWHEAGRIPGYALNGDGTAHDAVIFWKRIETPPLDALAGVSGAGSGRGPAPPGGR